MPTLKNPLLLFLPLMLASCGQLHPKSPTTIPALTQPSSSNSPASSATEPSVSCAMLSHGQVSQKDTTATLLWVLRLITVIDSTCGKPA